ncbi:pilus assembly protein TadG-related protein [Aquidulcibacter paucihalophilus]|uniref:pilus assembly protein TadG-related protein n=1 Tax=Aquidulcibacter paucihalophilus TaxID=1978549 RepID=UPI000A18FF13|nr:pilus assembly protein TadG-related protein [Aquidulcibacter paucihalophilus]
MAVPNPVWRSSERAAWPLDLKALPLTRNRLVFKLDPRVQNPGRGNVTVITALVAVPLSLILVAAIELTALSNEHAAMQAAVDAAALAGAQSMTIAGTSKKSASEYAEKFALSQVENFAKRAKVEFDASDGPDGSFTVRGEAIRSSFFGNLVPPGGFKINVEATAEALVKQPLCILGMDDGSSDKAVSGAGTSKITARGCVVHSNSNHEVKQKASIEAGTVRMTGKAIGTAFSPQPQMGALAIADPFKDRIIAPPKSCSSVPDGGEVEMSSGTKVLSPGTHRIEFEMSGTATLKLLPGEHYFCEDLEFEDESRLEGEDTVMILMNAELMVQDKTFVSLEGRRSGAWSGFVIVSSRKSSEHVSFKSPNVDRLLGTIYLPETTIYVTSPGSIADGSQWSVVVARNVITSNSANLVINSDYAGSPVPVPDGVGNRTGGSKSTPLRLRN